MATAKISNTGLGDFENLLAGIDTAGLGISPYALRYLQHIIGHKKFYIRLYAHVLGLVLANCPKAKENICLIDYGAGNGLLGLLAKHCGFGKVYINDISPVFIDAAKKLSVAIGVSPDGFIDGGIEAVKDYSFAHKPDAVASTDVLEHIYNLEIFFKSVSEINPAMVTVMNTASNPANYFKVRKLKKMQLKDEYEGGQPGDHALFGETAHGSFLSMRKKIIKEYAEGKLSQEEINKLATLSRGLQKKDIEAAVEKYLTEKILPQLIAHPTNTCDPITGSWTERVLSFDEYRSIYSSAGFTVGFYDGLYNEFEGGFKSSLPAFANWLVQFASHRLSPSITLVGKRKED